MEILPSWQLRQLAISPASFGFEDPENNKGWKAAICIVNTTSYTIGVEGFEPPHGGTKNRCLTAWRHPINSASISQQRQNLIR